MRDREANVGKKKGEGQSGGVNISGKVGSVVGDIVGGDKITTAPSLAALNQVLRPLAEAISAAPPAARVQAEAKLSELKQEVAKGEGRANDSVIAKLVGGLISLVPAAASAVVSAFATPMLGAIVGPITEYVLENLRGKK